MPYPNQQTVMPTHGGLAAGLDALMRIGNIQFTVNTVQKVANYTCLPTDSGTFFSAATGAVTFTLPATATSAGWWAMFANTVDAAMAVSAPTAILVFDGNATRTTLTWTVTSHKQGGMGLFYCDGTNWFGFAAANLSAVPAAS